MTPDELEFIGCEMSASEETTPRYGSASQQACVRLHPHSCREWQNNEAH